ncbi:osmotic avoidance abnormal protein 3-like isoform X1 [Tetranychus urticae]|uniref:osmotic avoidance abnormal protein 3-like isoform X1 n=1 Tax=Tetranychus urticae TaxID=32264 RepID=UPI000D64AFD4|nr:osmotic avoidance abnormal protein 3-like isoform X1 [Tetranychus urticae]
MSSEAVKVIVRCRPLNQREKDLKCKVIVQINPALGQCSIINPHDPEALPKPFTFDGAYFVDSTTEQIYNEIVFPIVESVTEGYNGTVFAYGQTGCGKSFTMQGITTPASQKGIIPRAFEHIFEAIAATENTKFLVHASYLEIYNEEIRDLLGTDSKKKLDLKEAPEQGVFVPGLSCHPVHDVKQCEQLMELGWKNRSVGATLMNADSSRSHSIFTVQLERMQTGEMADFDTTIRKGKLNLVDLAGSERQAKTGATGDRLKEATKINLSLSALGNVISALVDGKCKHIPYRDSKLTRLLQDSLGGNTKTLMVACLSPADNNYDETLSTLRYANRAKNIQNKPTINEDPKDALLREYQEEIQRLKSLLSTSTVSQISSNVIDNDVLDKIKQEYDQKMQELVEKHKEEQARNAQLKNDMNKLKETMEQRLIREGNEAIIHNEGDPDELINETPIQINGPMVSPVSDLDREKGNIAQIQAETIERIQALQERMVGGEKANDPELKEKRTKRKRIAERRMAAVSEALKKLDDDDQLLLKAYGDITEELRARTALLKRAKRKISTLESEVKDLQSEFETERTDYLETIRRQDQQIKLLAQILDKIQPCVRKDCNYANIDKVKSESIWDEDLQKWRLPELLVTRTKLPPPPGSTPLIGSSFGQVGRIQPGGREKSLFSRSISPGRSFSSNNVDDMIDEEDKESLSEFRLLQKFEKGAEENIAANYFKPKRREELLNNVRKVTNLTGAINGIRPNRLTGLHGSKSNLSNGNNLISNSQENLNNSLKPIGNFGKSMTTSIVQHESPLLANSSISTPTSTNQSTITNVNDNQGDRKLSKSLPSTRNGKEDDFFSGSLSAGELPRRPFRLQSIRVGRKEGLEPINGVSMM